MLMLFRAASNFAMYAVELSIASFVRCAWKNQPELSLRLGDSSLIGLVQGLFKFFNMNLFLVLSTRVL